MENRVLNYSNLSDDELSTIRDAATNESINRIAASVKRLQDWKEKQSEETKLLKEEFEDHKLNSPLSAIECDDLQALVKRTGIKALGGYKSPAYNNNSIRGKVYADIQHQLKREFDVRKYKAIKSCQYDKAREIVQAYALPMVLKQQIIALNNQIGIREAM